MNVSVSAPSSSDSSNMSSNSRKRKMENDADKMNVSVSAPSSSDSSNMSSNSRKRKMDFDDGLDDDCDDDGLSGKPPPTKKQKTCPVDVNMQNQQMNNNEMEYAPYSAPI